MKVLAPYLTADSGEIGPEAYDFFMQSRINQLKVNYWTYNNPTNDFPRPDASLQNFPYASTLGYQDGSFIKMRSINLGYTVPSKILAKAGISSLRVYVTALNPFILYSPFVKGGFGPDPEGNGYGGAVAVHRAHLTAVYGVQADQARRQVSTTNGSYRQIPA